MEFRIDYKVHNKMTAPDLSDVTLDGEVGIRFDRFVYERVNGKFAIEEILREAEDCFELKYDDEYCHGMWRSEFWGKLILSAVRVCRMKKDETLKADIKKSAYRILSMQDEDGYTGTYMNSKNFFPADKERSMKELGWPSNFNWNIWGRKYTLWGLIECAQLLDDEYILEGAIKHADSVLNQLRELGADISETGCLLGLASCSIMKPMLVLYRLCGDRKYLDFCLDIAKNWDRDDGKSPNLIRNGLSDESPASWCKDDPDYIAKAYEMMSCFDGLIELYRITGDKRLFDATVKFCDNVYRDEENILGSVGYCERFANAKSYVDSATEICDVIHWMRLCHELYMLTGELKYPEYMEKAFLNAFLAGTYEDGRMGAFFIRSSGRHWTGLPHCETKYQHCCTNNQARGFTNAAETIVSRCEDGYRINMYVQSRTAFGDTDFRIGMGYTDRGTVAITVRNIVPGEKLYLRIPMWSKNTAVIVNGESFPAVCGEYYALELKETNVVIRLRFDMSVEIIDFPGEFRVLTPDDYQYRRWVDDYNGRCDAEMMAKGAMSVLRRGPVILARSKRVGSLEEDMFSGRTIFGKADRKATAGQIRLDGTLCMARVTLTADGKTENLIMCDFASAANRNLEDVKYFNVLI
ncbi:MAG: glycoside hydrolase family 127 protein [Clostridia bacterium]|nr:glycoside hydrolase family 127 protein [Clostridia bacterium]